MLHKTSEGKVLLIACMDDTHLKSTINLFLKKIEEATASLTIKTDNIAYIIAGVDWESIIAHAKVVIRKYTSLLWPYVMEAMIRWIDYSARMQEVFWRSSAIGDSPVASLINFDDDDDDDY